MEDVHVKGTCILPDDGLNAEFYIAYEQTWSRDTRYESGLHLVDILKLK